MGWLKRSSVGACRSPSRQQHESHFVPWRRASFCVQKNDTATSLPCNWQENRTVCDERTASKNKSQRNSLYPHMLHVINHDAGIKAPFKIPKRQHSRLYQRGTHSIRRLNCRLCSRWTQRQVARNCYRQHKQGAFERTGPIPEWLSLYSSLTCISLSSFCLQVPPSAFRCPTSVDERELSSWWW